MPGVEGTMREFKKGTLKSGSGKKVTSRKQAIAIGLSEEREAGHMMPEKHKKMHGGKAKKKARRMRNQDAA